jgi:large subunit ribosomal protein L25
MIDTVAARLPCVGDIDKDSGGSKAMADVLILAAEKRDFSQKARALRRAGKLPAVVYGRAIPTTSVKLEADAAARTVAEAGYNRLIALNVSGDDQPQTVLVRDVQRDPVTRDIVHLDFYAVVADQTVSTEVPIVQTGVAPVVELGGTVVQTLESLEVECLPGDMPTEIVVDISGLESFGDSIAVADLPIPANVDVLADADLEVIHVAAPRMEEEEEEEEELLDVEGEEVEGEAAEGEGEEPEEEEEAE